jgi:hypothetical protein
MRAQSCVVHEIPNEREFLSQHTGLVSVELRLAVDLKRWKQMEVIRAGEMLSPHKQTLWDVPSASIRSETYRLIASVSIGFKAISKGASQGFPVLRLTAVSAAAEGRRRHAVVRRAAKSTR